MACQGHVSDRQESRADNGGCTKRQQSESKPGQARTIVFPANRFTIAGGSGTGSMTVQNTWPYSVEMTGEYTSKYSFPGYCKPANGATVNSCERLRIGQRKRER